MFLFGVTSCAFAFHGMSKASKDITSDAWVVVGQLRDYGMGVSDTLDHLIGTIDNVTLIIDDFQAIVRDDINVTGLTTHLTVSQGATSSG